MTVLDIDFTLDNTGFWRSSRCSLLQYSGDYWLAFSVGDGENFTGRGSTPEGAIHNLDFKFQIAIEKLNARRPLRGG